jgi:excinuclease UvrABC nuclease subunit
MNLTWRQEGFSGRKWVCFDVHTGKIYGDVVGSISENRYRASIRNQDLGSFVSKDHAIAAIEEHLTNPAKADFLTEFM